MPWQIHNEAYFVTDASMLTGRPDAYLVIVLFAASRSSGFDAFPGFFNSDPRCAREASNHEISGYQRMFTNQLFDNFNRRGSFGLVDQPLARAASSEPFQPAGMGRRCR